MLAIPVVEAADEPLVAINDRSALGLTELLLKNSRKVDSLVRDETWQADLIPRFLGIAVTSFSVFSLALAIILSLVPTDYLPNVLRDAWQRNPTSAGFSLGLADVLGLISATAVCLPVSYFYGLFTGVRVTVLQVTTHITEGMAATVFVLLGLLPVYVDY